MTAEGFSLACYLRGSLTSNMLYLTELETKSVDPNTLCMLLMVKFEYPLKNKAYDSILFFLQKMKADLNMKKSLLNALENELQKTLQIHSQSCQSYTLYDMDVGKFSDKVTQLIDRWQRADKQIDNRFARVS